MVNLVRIWGEHKASDCKENQKKPTRGREKPAHFQHIQHQEKGKNVVIDQHGFQQVRRRKNMRRNIFEGNHDMDQDKDGRGVNNNQPTAYGVAATAATQNDMSEEQPQNADTIIANGEVTAGKNNIPAEKDDNSAVTTATKEGCNATGDAMKEGSNANGKDGQQLRELVTSGPARMGV